MSTRRLATQYFSLLSVARSTVGTIGQPRRSASIRSCGMSSRRPCTSSMMNGSPSTRYALIVANGVREIRRDARSRLPTTFVGSGTPCEKSTNRLFEVIRAVRHLGVTEIRHRGRERVHHAERDGRSGKHARADSRGHTRAGGPELQPWRRESIPGHRRRPHVPVRVSGPTADGMMRAALSKAIR